MGWIVTARDLLRFAQGALAPLHVVVEHLCRRRHRGIGEAKRARVVFVARRNAKRVGSFGKGDLVLGGIGEAADDDARQPIFAFESHQIVLEGHDLKDETAWAMRLDLAPMLATRIARRGFDDAVVFGAIRIGEDDQPVAVMLDGIIVLGLERTDEAWRRRWIFSIDQAYLGGLMIVRAEQQETPVLGRVQTQKVAGVRLLIDECILSSWAYCVTQGLARAVLVIEPD